MIISSQAGAVFATDQRGPYLGRDRQPRRPRRLQRPGPGLRLARRPDPTAVGNLNNYLFAGTKDGNIFVTFTGGGGNGNAWLPLSNGLDGSARQVIVTNPNRGSHEAYAVTQKGVYHMVDASAGARTG